MAGGKGGKQTSTHLDIDPPLFGDGLELIHELVLACAVLRHFSVSVRMEASVRGGGLIVRRLRIDAFPSGGAATVRAGGGGGEAGGVVEKLELLRTHGERASQAICSSSVVLLRSSARNHHVLVASGHGPAWSVTPSRCRHAEADW